MGDFITMPKLGMTMTEGKIVKWLACEGERIGKGDSIFEVETDKTSLEADALTGGVLLKIYRKEGETVPVNSPVAFVGEEGEMIPDVGNETVFQEENTAPGQQKQACDYDLIVVGAGPGGYVCALRAAQLGAKVAVVERDMPGGTCLNRGCIPTKAYYESARRWREVWDCAQFGIEIQDASFHWERVLERKNGIVDRLRIGIETLLRKNGIERINGNAVIRKADTVEVDGKTYRCRHIVLATGAKAAHAVATAEQLQTTDTVLDMGQLPDSIAIIGGGVIGCEMASILNAFGVRVTIIEALLRILPAMDEEVADCLLKEMRKNGIEVLTGTTCKSITKSGEGYRVVLEDGQEIMPEMVLEAVGRVPECAAFEGLGVELSPEGYVKTDEWMRTSIPTVYAIGDVNGRFQLAHAASAQGILAAEHMFADQKPAAMEMVIPACVFAELEIACAGITEQEAKEKGIPVKVSKFPYSANGKALAMGAGKGFVKVIADERWGEILGVHIIGEGASSLIGEAVMAMRCEATADAAGEAVHAHPTLSEALMEAFLGAGKGALHQ
ncbi:dihydrolipoyl dehydrogenase [Christensenella tenuis]|jgi:dihydrolipoamide dehydrogenase|uniref:Dihydrolipoyl dehydrogenase n=1 Tax=Christensenella tenuis TaxID=2763033 RepID=A0ABR7EAI4_9FIRM|nr:dihydrolipoyl dehydrogenase [Christensenella tenuis]MBC5646788.1 dihydrolipoyl dehydrogenase [Christensenella tenuis]